MIRRTVRLSSVAIFLAVILITMLLSRFEEAKKTAVEQGGTPTGTQATAKTEENRAVPVLMYHHLLHRAENTRYSGNDIVTYVEDFEAQLDWLQAQGFSTITPDQLVAWYYDGAPLPEKPVMITFDDGYLSNYIYAYPLLKEKGYTAVIFSVTGKIADTPVSFRPDHIDMLDTASMQAASDVFFYASHTHAMHSLNGKRSALVTSGADAVKADLSASLAAVRQYSSGTGALFSYPYGNYSSTVESILKDAGVRLAFRAYKGRLTRQSNPYELPRYPVSYAVSMKTFQSYFSEYVK